MLLHRAAALRRTPTANREDHYLLAAFCRSISARTRLALLLLALLHGQRAVIPALLALAGTDLA